MENNLEKESSYCKKCKDNFWNKGDCKSIKKFEMCVFCRKEKLAKETL